MKKALTLILWLGMILSVSAQLDTSRNIYRKPMLGGHAFHMNDQAKSPFIKTYLAGSIGMGNTGTMYFSGYIVGDKVILDFSGQLMFFNAGLEYQQRVNDWLAIYFNYGLVGRVGSDVSTILVDGLNSLSGGSIGWLIRLYHNDRFQLSGTLYLQNLSGSFVDIVGYINDLLDSVPNPEITKNIPVMNGGVGLKGAWAASQTIGVLFETDFLYGESFVRGVNSFFTGISLSGDVDFNPRYQVPVGLNFGYAFSSRPENTLLEFDHTNIFHLRIGYTGSSDFDVGLQFSFYRYELTNIEERRPWVKNTSLGFRLYF